jgi:hypothetical protein
LKLNPQKQHGDGCPFINKIENVVSALKSPVAAGFMAMGLALKN